MKMTKQITLKSRFGKSLQFESSNIVTGATSVTLRDSEGVFIQNILFNGSEMNLLAGYLAPEPQASSDKGVFFLLRQKVDKPSKVKICFAPESGIVDGKEYTSRAKAQRAARNLNDQYGSKWNYFVVEKETV
jgi:hypothetical protein